MLQLARGMYYIVCCNWLVDELVIYNWLVDALLLCMAGSKGALACCSLI